MVKCLLNDKKYLRRPRLCRIVKIFVIVIMIPLIKISFNILNFVLIPLINSV